MKSTLVGPALVLVAGFAGAGSVRAGGAPPATYVRAPLASTWRTTIRAGSADALAIDQRGRPGATKWAYVANGRGDTVTKFGTGGRRLRTWSYGPVTRYTSPVAIAVGGSGNVFVADGSRRRIVKFDPFGRRLAVFGGFNLPDGIALDGAGDLYVADLNAQAIVKLSPSGTILARWHVPWVDGSGTGQPRSVAVDRAGNVFVGIDCFGDNCPPPHGIQNGVLELGPSGALEGSLVGNNPYVPVGSGEQAFVTVDAVALLGRDTLYVGGDIRTAGGEFREGILVYGPGLSLSARYFLPGSAAPTGIAFDGRNHLYVAQDGRVLERLP